MDMLYAGSFFQPELRLAVGTGQIAVGLEIPDFHILALEKVSYSGIDTEKTVIPPNSSTMIIKIGLRTNTLIKYKTPATIQMKIFNLSFP